MSRQLSKHIEDKLSVLLANVGDMSLKRRAKRMIEELELTDKERVIDICCGNGYYSYLLSRMPVDIDVYGIDNEERAIQDAKIYVANKKVRLSLCDVYSIPFKSQTFDKAIMSEAIEHLANGRKALIEVHRILKPGGILVLTTTNSGYPFLWDPINWLLDHLFKTHIKRGFWAGIWNQHNFLYTKEEIQKKLRQAGFKIKKLEVLTFWCLPFNHYLLNAVAKLVYSKQLPRQINDALLKFKSVKKPLFIRIVFGLVNWVDRLNDSFPKESGVSIFIKAKKVTEFL